LVCPLRVIITGDERADVTQVPAFLLEERSCFICDPGYDADWARERISDHQSTFFIPGRKNRIGHAYYDRGWYCSRPMVETPFNASNPPAALPRATNRASACT
jgi:hypothetical protein